MRSKKYFYNPKSHTLHIVGYCGKSKNMPNKVIYFDSEDAAVAKEGRALSMCKNCMKKRDKMLPHLKSV